MVAQQQLHPSHELRNACWRSQVRGCVACDVVMCMHCRENNWDHEKSSLRRGVSMPPTKARKFEEMLDDEAPLQKQ